jgi:5-methyltetrahydrofolate--homocysteine methyltransferase
MTDEAGKREVRVLPLPDRLHSGKVLLMDGAMGTELMRRGARPSHECCELWNLTHPDEVRAVHRAYHDAGAEVLLTNTFQVNPRALARHGLQQRLAEIWSAAVRLARAECGPTTLVLADVGPVEASSDLQPVLDLCGDVDGILLETWSNLDHLRTVRSAGIPLLVSFAYQRGADGRLVTFCGESPEACARAAQDVGAYVVGANCGWEVDMRDFLSIVRAYRSAVDLPLLVRPNAGTPEEGRYPRLVDQLASQLPALLAAGVTMVGGCCGTTPAHIAAFQKVCTAWKVEPPSG